MNLLKMNGFLLKVMNKNIVFKYMIEIDKNLQTVIFLFLCTLFLLYKLKPNKIFNDDGSLKQFGTGKEKTITPLWLVSLLIGLMIYVFITVRKDDFV